MEENTGTYFVIFYNIYIVNGRGSILIFLPFRVSFIKFNKKKFIIFTQGEFRNDVS